MESIGIKFPFKETERGGIFGVTKTESEKINSNLIAFLTLRKGQRVMNNNLYSPLYDYIHETWDEISEGSLYDELKQSIEVFFPEIITNDIIFNFNETENLLNIKIIYTIISLKIQETVELALPIEI